MRAARLAVLAVVVTGCSAKDQPREPNAPTVEELAPAPPEPALFSENETWTVAEAVARLDDAAEGVRAAVRLVRLAGLRPLCVPEPLPADWAARRLGVRRLGESRWALGVEQTQDASRLRGTVLINSDGSADLAAEGLDEELAVLHCSEDTRRFPHVLVLPDRVLLLNNGLAPALVGRSMPGCHFECRRESGRPEIALVWVGGAGESRRTKVVARYRWDVLEAVFAGPTADALPEPEGAFFELDDKRSVALLPLGGRTPPPAPIVITSPPPEVDGPDH
jgi:hypothetical protein